mmetsp:Transcript_30298/g.87371  ORF Transcript_30298/g.87371 Transcript_30298/m.87371 type:complete len:82 (-) Transcript_30298:390-635(-)
MFLDKLRRIPVKQAFIVIIDVIRVVFILITFVFIRGFAHAFFPFLNNGIPFGSLFDSAFPYPQFGIQSFQPLHCMPNIFLR